MARAFISYSHADEELKVQLERHLSLLRRNGLIDIWNDRCILPGSEFAGAIDANLESADIILLLVSHNFIASDYCFEIEMTRALERHQRGEAVVVPIILDACLWHSAPFGKINALPTDGKPIRKYPNINEGFTDVAAGIERLLNQMGNRRTSTTKPSSVGSAPVTSHPRSSNLHVKRDFTRVDKDRFVRDTFDYIAKYFEGSLEELKKRNQAARIDTDFERIDAQRFVAKIYRDGDLKSVCTISRGNNHFGDIGFSHDENNSGNSVNDSLTLKEADGTLSFSAMMGSFRGERREGMSQEGAAEYYWELFVDPLQ